METVSATPLLAVLVSAFAGVLILFSRRLPALRESWTFIAAFIKFGLVASLYPLVKDGGTVIFTLTDFLPDAPLFFRVDSLGLTFALLSSFLWLVTSVYSVGYVRALKEHAQTRYYFSFALSLSAALGIAFAGDLVTFFIFYELLTLATYPLVAHKENQEALKAARKYLVYSLSAGGLMLLAIAWTYLETGSTAFASGGFLAGQFDARFLGVLFFLFIYGCGVKASLFPVHAWLPSAMVAPVPVSALLHAVAVVKAGVFGVLRITGYVFGPDLLHSTRLSEPLAAIAAFTLLGASIIALAQDNLKRRLAYSTISQLSYIILGAALLTPTAMTGAVLHLVNHAFLKITLFFCAGIIYVQAHKENISDLRGLGRKMPLTFILFGVGSLGLAGFPPMSGFISKWFLCQGAVDTGMTIFLTVYLISSLLNLAYFVPVLISAFLPVPAGQKEPEVHAQNWQLLIPACITASLGLAFGCVPGLVLSQYGLAAEAAKKVFGG